MHSLLPLGKVEDMGDVVLQTRYLVKGKHYGLVFKVGAQLDVPAKRRPTPGKKPEYKTKPERIGLYMDLGADKKVTLSATFTDELGHSVPAPEGATVEWSVDDSSIINLTVNEDGTAVAAATGELGNAVVHVEVEFPNGAGVSGDLLISVVAGEAERVVITPGTVEEVTPDETVTPEPAPEPTPEEPTQPEGGEQPQE